MPLMELTVLQTGQILDDFKRTGVELTKADIAQIADALAKNRIRRLVLDACGLTAEDATTLSGAIIAGRSFAAECKQPESLELVSLKGNKLGNDGASAMGAVLAVNSTLQSMDLSGNHILDSGGIALAAGLETNRSLVKLDLSCNMLSDVAVKRFTEAALRNPDLRLRAADFSRNNIPLIQVELVRFERALEMRRYATTLLFSRSVVGPSLATTLAQGFVAAKHMVRL